MIREQLVELAEENYKVFSSNLLPGIDNLVGVRIPNLRKIAKQIVKLDWKSYIENNDEIYFEEVMLKGMIIGYLENQDIEDILKYISDFVPKINNWSVCDSFCVGLKITNKNRERVWEFLKPYICSDKEFEVRFAVVMMINYYINEDYLKLVLKELDNISHDGYYAKMAVAWAISISFVKFEELTLEYLKNNNIDDYTYNKSLQKICESLKVKKDTKDIIRSMKRKRIRLLKA
ncbi:DNA alkylation repair protein [Clostridium sp. CCUG 7971]|uniref:DNA alkylation repair protein n=1 Tax=Clostridium sp. CCUG 7971 TaxID=2811414 RepID=UPI001ABA9AED|nr:DNA alkylation repair protein [Clostridium sp. CCUG 7971]MBO3444739.1 DNA alkylation repair protein [Clostridium sp. CCUG 7971]